MKTILVGTDYTPAGNIAVRYAAEMAFQYKARLVVVHATQLMMVSESPWDLRYMLDEIENADKKKMLLLEANLKKKYDNRLKLTTDVQTGFVSVVLQNKTHQYHPDLIVMGMPQVDFLSKKLFGSTAVKMISNSTAPVLIIPEASRFKPLHKIVLAADGLAIKSKKGIIALDEVLKRSRASLEYLHIKDDLYPGYLKSYWNKLHTKFGTDQDAVHELTAVSGKTSEQIHEWSKKHKADWIVAVARERNLFWNIFHESVSKKLAYLSRLPVLIIHDK